MGGADGGGFVLVGGEFLNQGEDEGDVWIGRRGSVGEMGKNGMRGESPGSVA